MVLAAQGEKGRGGSWGLEGEAALPASTKVWAVGSTALLSLHEHSWQTMASQGVSNEGNARTGTTCLKVLFDQGDQAMNEVQTCLLSERSPSQQWSVRKPELRVTVTSETATKENNKQKSNKHKTKQNSKQNNNQNR